MCYVSFCFYPRWKQYGSESAISWDVSGYYWYLPSAFIYHDLRHQGFKDSILKKYNPTGGEFQQGVAMPNGNYVMKYASGMAVMYLPFFTAAHLVAGALGYPRDGFSAPYQFFIQFGGLLISILGLWYLRKLLLNFYNDKVVAIVLLLLVFGTNYLNYAAIDCGMSHCWLFTVYVFILLNTHYFYTTFRTKYAVRIGLLVGLATLTRPTDAISCLIPLLWGMESISPVAIKKQINLFIKNYKALIIAGICGTVVVSIQLIYWKYASGHWLVYSYQDQKLYFRSPNIFKYTFSYRSGWLVYAPMMSLAFVGVIPFFKQGKNKVAILTFFFFNFYIVCAWSIWWYGGRAMVQSYPVLMFCVAALAKVALDRKVWLVLLAPFALVFIYFNAWITYSYHKGGAFDIDCMSRSYFWKVAGQWWTAPPAKYMLLKDNNDLFEGAPHNVKTVYQNNFSTDTGSAFLPNTSMPGKTLQLDKAHNESPVFKFAFSDKTAQWMRADAVFHCDAKESDVWKMAQFVVRIMNKGVKVQENMIRVYRVLDAQETKDISLDIKLPSATYDSVNILFWNADSDVPLQINTLQVKTFNNNNNSDDLLIE
jgi:hypothetical protein